METSQRKRIWGWWFFDWASQPYHTLLVTFVFGPYFAATAAQHYIASGMAEEAAKAQATSAWAVGMLVAGLIIGLGAPVIGAMADIAGRRMPWMVAFSLMYVAGSGALWWTYPDASNLWLMLSCFVIGFIGAEYALIFINGQLPDLGTPEETGRISGSGFAFGYLGGLVSLTLMLLLFVEQGNGKTLIGLDPIFGLDASEREGTRSVGPFSALWYAVFMIPYFLWYRDRPRSGRRATLGLALRSVWESIRRLRYRGSLAAYLGSSMFYRDALNGLYAFGGTYAALVLEWQLTAIGIFGIVALVSSALFSWAGGMLDTKTGPKPVIVACVVILMGVCAIIVGMSRETLFGVPLPEGSALPDAIFFGCGVLIGGLGGVLQSASRSMMVRHSDPDLPTESFGLYGLSGRATAFLAPTLIALVTTMSGSTRIGISPVIGLFAIGLLLLVWVKPEGDRA
ncbi:MAG: MFS transporter [Pseudooceanicola sp.]|nr:MFS transporter [Pseudooceanicola sp.]